MSDGLKQDINSEAAKVIQALREMPDVEIVMPQFNRGDNLVVFPATPTVEWFDSLKTKTDQELKDLGCQKWDKDIWLFPVEWYDSIPDQYPIVDIFEKEELFKVGKTDNDSRYGALAYGFRQESLQGS